MSDGWGKQLGRWRKVDRVSFSRVVEEVPLQATSQSSQSPAAAAGPQPRGAEDADAENNADTSSVIFTEVGDSRASSQTLDHDAEELTFPQLRSAVWSARPLQRTVQI